MISSLNVDAMSKEELYRLFKVYKTLNKMMEDRGYEKLEKEPISYEQWEKNIKEKRKMSGIFSKIIKNDVENGENTQNEQNDKKLKTINLFFHYIPNIKINKDCILNFIEEMQTGKAISGMIITSTKLSQQAKQQIENSKEIEVFDLKELVVNITEHELVPKHILLSEKDKKQLLERYKIRDSQLPKILVGDPVAKYLGLKRGDVVKIIRESETAGRYITYRIAS